MRQINHQNCASTFATDVPDNEKYTLLGKYVIKVIARQDGIEEQIFSQIQQVVVSDIDDSKFVVEWKNPSLNPNNIELGKSIEFTIKSFDSFNNPVRSINFEDFEVVVTGTQNNSPIDVLITQDPGIVEAEFKVTSSELHSIVVWYKGKSIKPLNSNAPSVIFGRPLECQGNKSFFLREAEEPIEVILGEQERLTFRCADKFGNLIFKGGEKPEVTLKNYAEEFDELIGKFEDNNDGTYTVILIPIKQVNYTLLVFVNNSGLKNVDVKGKIKQVKEGQFYCPSLKKEMLNVSECLNNNCKADKPFKCLVNKKEACVFSRTECDCPEGSIKCLSTNACIPAESENSEQYFKLCPMPFSVLDCHSEGLEESPLDGNCRAKGSLQPSRIVCPLAHKLCPDSSCVLEIEDCNLEYDFDPSNIVCFDLSQADYAYNCPSRVVCPVNQVVCSDGKCVNSEHLCQVPKKCQKEGMIRCALEKCATSKKECSSTKRVCNGRNKFESLCSDLNCRLKC